jgi:hypothetical protein
LTDRSSHPTADRAPPPERHGDEVLSRALGRARWTIFWERLWPGLASIATVIGLFLRGLVARAVALAAADRPRHRSRRLLPARRGGVCAAV